MRVSSDSSRAHAAGRRVAAAALPATRAGGRLEPGGRASSSSSLIDM